MVKIGLEEYATIIRELFNFGLRDLFVIRNTHSGMITANFILPMAFRFESDKIGMKGDFVVSLTEPIVLDEERNKL